MSEHTDTAEAEEGTDEQVTRTPESKPGEESGSQESSRTQDSGQKDDEQDTFPRDYVEKLRDENAKYRQRAQQSDELAHRLHRALVAADGRLADPSDLDYDDEHLEDGEALTAAVDDLLARKPHLAARKPHGDVGQGAVSGSTSTVDLAGLLRAGAN